MTWGTDCDLESSYPCEGTEVAEAQAQRDPKGARQDLDHQHVCKRQRVFIGSGGSVMATYDGDLPDPPYSPDLLADLHAGNLPESVALRLWPLARRDPAAAAV